MIKLDLQSRVPIYEQLSSRIEELVMLEVLRPNDQLPSVRSLARELGINPNTVQKAYQDLERDGVIYSAYGKGSFVADGEAGRRLLRERQLERIKEMARELLALGISRADAVAAVSGVYDKEDKA